MSANEVPDAVLTEVGYVAGFTDDGDPVINPTNSVVRLQYYGIPVGITVTQTDTGTDLRIELGEDGFTLRLLPGAVLQLGSPFDNLELQNVTDGVVAQLLRAATGEFEVYRALLDEADSEIAWLEFWAGWCDQAINTLLKYVKRQERTIKRLKRQRRRAYDKGFQAALALAPGEGSDTPDLEQALTNGSQDPEFAAARAEHESSTT